MLSVVALVPLHTSVQLVLWGSRPLLPPDPFLNPIVGFSVMLYSFLDPVKFPIVLVEPYSGPIRLLLG